MSDDTKPLNNPVAVLVSFAITIGALIFASMDSLMQMEAIWGNKEEYGYAYIIPFIVLFFVWQRKNVLLEERLAFSWLGFVVLAFGVFVIFLGNVSTTHSIAQYGFITAVIGAVLQFVGWRAFKQILLPLLLLYLMVPLPAFLYNNLSSELQLVSSSLGVWVIRLFDISVYLEGNVIDLGVYKLQVVEACSGLRYLFPLFSLSIIAAFIYQAATWKRVVVVLSSIPITIFMNSFRIGVIGVLVEYWGIEQAEGFLHDFEGWIIFMACTGLLVLEIWLLTYVGKERKRFSDVFGIVLPDALPKQSLGNLPSFSPVYVFAVVAMLAASAGISAVQQRDDIFPERKSFAEFPLTISGWAGKANRMESIYLDQLKLDDYIIADYKDSQGAIINFYAAYYAAQRSGEAAHSPRSCIPGGGWLIESHKELALANVPYANGQLKVNRLLIKKGDYTQLVYYWFQQRGRDITNEYMVKWYLFWDALSRSRTDGALVRLTTFVGRGQDLEAAEANLQSFAAEVVPQLGEFIPE